MIISRQYSADSHPAAPQRIRITRRQGNFPAFQTVVGSVVIRSEWINCCIWVGTYTMNLLQGRTTPTVYPRGMTAAPELELSLLIRWIWNAEVGIWNTQKSIPIRCLLFGSHSPSWMWICQNDCDYTSRIGPKECSFDVAPKRASPHHHHQHRFFPSRAFSIREHHRRMSSVRMIKVIRAYLFREIKYNNIRNRFGAAAGRRLKL